MTGLGLNAQAARRALDDSGLALADIDGVLTAYSFTEPYFMLGSVLCEYLGLKPRFNASMICGGASPAVMLKHAAEAIVAGQAETILVCAGENRATGQSRDAAVTALLAVGHPYFEQPYGGSIPGYYAMIANRHMHEYGTTREQLAHVAVNTRGHALLHPNAHMKKALALQDVLEAKPIADPLGMLDCCLISDAGGAFIVTSAERARDLKSRPAYLQGIGEYHTHEHLMCAPSLTEFGATESGRIAYEMAGPRSAGRRRGRTLRLLHHRADHRAGGARLLRAGAKAAPSSPKATPGSAASCRSTPTAACCRTPMPVRPEACSASSRPYGSCAAVLASARSRARRSR